MHPILFETPGGFAFHTYGALGAIGFLFTAFLALWRMRKLGVPPERTTDLIFYTALLSLAGARVVFIAQNPDQFHTFSDYFNLRGGGLVFYGALLTGIVVGSGLMKRFDMPLFATWDIFATGFPISHALARLGCLGAGCCYGSQTDLPWGITFTHPLAGAPKDVPLHPTQLYEAGWLLLVGLVVNVFYSRKQFDGQVMALYLVLYAIGRSFIEMFRGDLSRGFFLEAVLGQALTYSQGISVVVVLIAALVYVGGRRADAEAASAA